MINAAFRKQGSSQSGLWSEKNEVNILNLEKNYILIGDIIRWQKNRANMSNIPIPMMLSSKFIRIVFLNI